MHSRLAILLTTADAHRVILLTTDVQYVTSLQRTRVQYVILLTTADLREVSYIANNS
jgi:hypothetical protein